MERLKRALSLFLTLSMLLGLMIVPGRASDAPATLKASIADAEIDATTSGNKRAVVSLNIDENPGFGSLTVRIYYKRDAVKCDLVAKGSEWTTFENAGTGTDEDSLPVTYYTTMFENNRDDTNNIDPEKAADGWAMASLGVTVNHDPKNHAGNIDTANFTGEIAKIRFIVEGDNVESGTTPIEVEIAKATGADTAVELPAAGSNSILTIKGVPPTIATDNGVTIDDAAVTVDGDNNGETQVHATSERGTDITGIVTWSVENPSGVTGDPVQVDANGKVTVNAKAPKGTYTIKAAGDNVNSAGSGEVPLTVEHGPSKVKTITISYTNTTIAVPTVNDGGTKTGDAPTVTVKDQFGEKMESGYTLVWSVTGADGSEPAGISVGADGAVTVTSAASGGAVNVKAASGDAESDAVEFTIDKATPAATSFVVKRGDSTIGTTDTLVKPAPGIDSVPYDYSVEVKDQFGAVMKGETANWKIDPTNNAGGKVTVSSNGTVSVSKDAAKDATATLKVTVGSLPTKTIIITITDLTVNWDAVVTKKDSITYGQTYGDAVSVATGTVIAKAGDVEVPGTLSVKDSDQYPAAGTATVTVVFTPNKTGGAYDNAEVTQQYTVPVSQKKVTVVAADATKVYGAALPTFELIPPAAGVLVGNDTVTDLGVTLTTNATAASDVGDYTISCASPSGANYAVTVTPGKLSITKAPLSVKPDVTDPSAIKAYAAENTAGGLNTLATSAVSGLTVEGVEINGTKQPVNLTASAPTTSTDFNKQGGTYTYTASLTSDSGNYEYKGGDVTVTVTVDPVKATQITSTLANNTVSVAEVEAADATLAKLGIPDTVTVEYNDAKVPAGSTSCDAVWNTDLTALRNTAKEVTAEKSKDVAVKLEAVQTLPDWASLEDGVEIPNAVLTISTRKSATIAALDASALSKTYDGTDVDDPDVSTLGVTDTKTGTPITPEAGDWSFVYNGSGDTKYGPTADAPFDAGTYTVTAVFTSLTHEGRSNAAAFTISPKEIDFSAGFTNEGLDEDLTYNGKAQTLKALVIKDGEKTLEENTDYTLTYADNTNAGTNSAKITVTGKGNYGGTPQLTFTIKQFELTTENTTLTGLSTTGYTYTGAAIKPTVSVKATGFNTLTADTDYTITYDPTTATDAGDVKITVTGANNFKGVLTDFATYKINPAALKGTVTLTHTKGAGNTETEKYEVGDKLTADFSKLTEHTEANLDFQWYNAAGAISDAKTKDYVIREGDGEVYVEVSVKTDAASNYTGKAASQKVAVNKKSMPADVSVSITVEKDSNGKITLTADITVSGGGSGTEVVTITSSFRVQWYRNNAAVGDPIEVTATGGTLNSVAYPADAAEQPAGGEVWTCALVPADEGSDYTGSIPASSSTPTDGTSGDNGNVSIDPTAPSAPTNVQAALTKGATTGSVKVTWGMPANMNGCDLDGWEVTRSDGTTSVSKKLGASDAREYTFDNLTNGTKYTFTVRALTTTSGVTGETSTGVEVTPTAPDPVTPSRPSGGGGSSSGSSSSNTANVTIKKTSNGSVSASPTRAKKGDTVTLTVTPKNGYELDEITVLDKNGDRVRLRDGEKANTFTFTMPEGSVTVETSFRAVEETSENPFRDVSENAYYYDAVLWALENDITGGTTATTFSPNSACTRAQTVTFLWRAAGRPSPSSTMNPFTDVNPGAYYYDAVLWAVEQGITNGLTATTFGPNATVNRGQVVTFLYRSAGASPVDTPNPFNDVPESAYYASPVLWAVANGVTNGTSGVTFSPASPCTRGQIVTFLYRHFT